MKIRFTAPAKQDLIEIQDYIARNDAAAAYRVAQRIRTQIGHLAQHPQLGRPGHIAGTRELSITGTPYVVVYRIERRSIDVLTMFTLAGAGTSWPRTLPPPAAGSARWKRTTLKAAPEREGDTAYGREPLSFCSRTKAPGAFWMATPPLGEASSRFCSGTPARNGS